MIKEFILLQFLASTLFLTSACLPTKTQEKKPPIVDVLVSKSHKIKPEWAKRGAGTDTDEHLFFVGKSGKHAEEADAVDTARSKAGKAFIELTGVEIKIFEEYLTSSEGRSSIARDAKKVGETKTKMTSEGYFRGLKVVETYSENYSKKQGDHVLEKYWRVWVLVRVPQKEKFAVQEWKREREERADSLLKQQLNDSKKAAQNGDLFGALDQLSLMLSIAPNQPTPKKDDFIAEAKSLEVLWLNSIEFSPLSPKTQIIELGSRFEPFQVKVEIFLNQKRIPVRNFPVIFNMGANNTVRYTNLEGVASVEISPSPGVGEDYLMVSPDKTILSDKIRGKDLSYLYGKRVNFRIAVKVSFLNDRIKNDYNLRFFSNLEGDYKVGDNIKVTGICEKRCFIRIYYWDGKTAELVKGEGERTMIKNKPNTLLGFKLRESGKFRLVALSTTEKFVDLANKEKKYTGEEFEEVLSRFRNMNMPKAEEHLEFSVNGN